MREFLVLLVLLPVALVVVLNQELAKLQASAPVPTPVVIHVVVPTPTAAPAIQTGSVSALIANALTWLGTPYAWGGCSRAGVDCSCFVMLNLATVGIPAPRVTTDQIRWVHQIGAAEARAGDLVFFDNTCTGCGANPTHVALYLGNGKAINAGDPVQINNVFSGFLGAHLASFGRPPGL